VKTGSFQNYEIVKNGFNKTVPHDVHKRKEFNPNSNPNSLQPITDMGGSEIYMEL